MKRGSFQTAGRETIGRKLPAEPSGFTTSKVRQWCGRAVAGQHRPRFAQTSLRPDGFTIVETMIVLAVTGILLISALTIIGGRQAQTEFQTGITTLQSQIQQTINEIQKGYYPDASTFSCKNVGGAPIFGAGGTEQGANGGCLFIGKVLQFGTTGDNTQYFTYPAVSSQYLADGSTPSTNIVTSATGQPKLAASLAAATHLQGLSVDGVYYNNIPYNVSGTQIGAFAVLAGDATGTFGPATSTQSGSEQFSLYAIKTTTISDATSLTPAKFTASANRAAVQNVEICVTGGKNRWALVTIGGPNGGLGVESTVRSGAHCV